VIAPPRMGGAKLNIIYTVGDVPILAPNRGISSHTLAAQTNDNTQQRITPSSSSTASSGAPSTIVANKNSRSGGDFSPHCEQNVSLPETRNNFDQSSTLYEEHDRF